MQIAHDTCLRQHVRHDARPLQELGSDLVLVRTVGADGGDEAAGCNVVAAEDRRSRHGAGDDNVGVLGGRARGMRNLPSPPGGGDRKAVRCIRVEVVAQPADRKASTGAQVIARRAANEANRRASGWPATAATTGPPRCCAVTSTNPSAPASMAARRVEQRDHAWIVGKPRRTDFRKVAIDFECYAARRIRPVRLDVEGTVEASRVTHGWYIDFPMRQLLEGAQRRHRRARSCAPR